MFRIISYIERKLHLAPAMGVTGILLLISAMLLAASTFEGYEPSYSIFNHFISELGDTGQSPFFWLFSLGLCIAGPFTVMVIIALANYLDTPLSRAAKAIGIVSGLAGFFVGIFPADLLKIPHLIAALIFFVGTLITLGLFGLSIFLDSKNKIAKWYAVPSFTTSLTGIIFLSLPNEMVREFLLGNPEFCRPDFWLNPFFEWLVFFSLAIWVILIAKHLHEQDVYKSSLPG